MILAKVKSQNGPDDEIGPSLEINTVPLPSSLSLISLIVESLEKDCLMEWKPKIYMAGQNNPAYSCRHLSLVVGHRECA